MTAKKYSPKTINEMIKDERTAVADYKKKGLTSFAKDEKRHLNYWEKQKKK